MCSRCSAQSACADFNDEVGFKADVYYALSPEITINVNGSRPAAFGYSRASFLTTWDRVIGCAHARCEVLPSGSCTPKSSGISKRELLRAAFNRRFDAPYEATSPCAGASHAAVASSTCSDEH
jgi:hypothetical protein